jgi:hypothetical protein
MLPVGRLSVRTLVSRACGRSTTQHSYPVVHSPQIISTRLASSCYRDCAPPCLRCDCPLPRSCHFGVLHGTWALVGHPTRLCVATTIALPPPLSLCAATQLCGHAAIGLHRDRPASVFPRRLGARRSSHPPSVLLSAAPTLPSVRRHSAPRHRRALQQ